MIDNNDLIILQYLRIVTKRMRFIDKEHNMTIKKVFSHLWYAFNWHFRIISEFGKSVKRKRMT